jgi:hypothetical protein
MDYDSVQLLLSEEDRIVHKIAWLGVELTIERVAFEVLKAIQEGPCSLSCEYGRCAFDVSTLFQTKNLIGFSGLLIEQRSEVAMRRMAPLAVRAHVDVCTHRRLRLRVRVPGLHLDHCGLEGMEAALRHRVLPTGALPAHPRLYLVLAQELPSARSALLTATVRVHAPPRGGLPLRERHRSRLGHPRCPHRVSHGPPAHSPRAQRQDDGERPPACAWRQGGHVPNVSPLWGVAGHVSLALRRRHGLGGPCGGGRLASPPRCAAPTGWGEPASQATAAHPSACLRHARRAPTRTIRATPRRTLALPCVPSLRLRVPLAARGTPQPRLRAPARALQALAHAPAAALRVLLGDPGVLDGRWCAQDAAAVCPRAPSACTRAWSFRRRWHASERWAAWTGGAWRATRWAGPLPGGNGFACTPRSRAVWARDGADSTAHGTARSLHAAGYLLVVG